MKLTGIALPVLATALSATLAGAQQPPQPPSAAALPIPEVGSLAPDFDFTPVTKDGIQKPTRLSALKGQTVVVWFFFKARTRG